MKASELIELCHNHNITVKTAIENVKIRKAICAMDDSKVKKLIKAEFKR